MYFLFNATSKAIFVEIFCLELNDGKHLNYNNEAKGLKSRNVMRVLKYLNSYKWWRTELVRGVITESMLVKLRTY